MAAVPKFDKVPWLSEASLTNKPLVLSLPRRSQSSAAFLSSSKRCMNSPIFFEVPDVSPKAGRNQTDPRLLRSKWLCSTCREVKMQPRTVTIPDDHKLSFKNFVNHRMMSLHQPKAKAMPKPSDDILAESIHYRLPIVGPRTAVFHGLLSDIYKTLQETQLSSLPGKKPQGTTVKQ
ncbi:uncharacterized protein C1orf105 homolog [Cavia porcellus]|uniref:uncharacterized protein C1orf105 homolog n=1 Tax=Cavia porcellus TaxID=10141 RepID=UPI002FDF9D9F